MKKFLLMEPLKLLVGLTGLKSDGYKLFCVSDTHSVAFRYSVEAEHMAHSIETICCAPHTLFFFSFPEIKNNGITRRAVELLMHGKEFSNSNSFIRDCEKAYKFGLLWLKLGIGFRNRLFLFQKAHFHYFGKNH